MLLYRSRLHRWLMDESEQALVDAADGGDQRECRIARQVLSDTKTYQLWESRHANIVCSAAEQSKRVPQIFALRDIEVRLLHRRALIKHIRKHHIVGTERDNLFAHFYGPLDTTNAILREHRQYILAVSSRVSTDHLIDLMRDQVSVRLLNGYESIYSAYFETYCYVANCRDTAMANMVKPEMRYLRKQAMRMIKRIQTQRPEGNRQSNFERQALLARSGRYPTLEYMTG